MTTFEADEVCPALVLKVMEERAWTKYKDDPTALPPAVWWKLKRFLPAEHDKAASTAAWRNTCRLNHWPHSMRLTNKNDLRKELGRLAKTHGSDLYNFAPLSYCLPAELSRWTAEQQQKTPTAETVWICKPVGLSQGRGIFLTTATQLASLDWRDKPETVVQKYIANPLLIGGHKFDLRLYVLVDSLAPFKVHLFDDGLARFAAHRYNPSDLSDRFSHLTNATINKEPNTTAELASNIEPLLGPGCGSKWKLSTLRTYLRTLVGVTAESSLWCRVEQLIVLTSVGLCSDVMMSGQLPKFFEVFGFDVLVDDTCTPHLMEVNFSPSLGCDCSVDREVKMPMLHSLFNVLNIPPLILPDPHLHFKQLYPTATSTATSSKESASSCVKRVITDLRTQKC